MQRIHWKKRIIVYVLLTTAVFYLLFRLRKYKYEMSIALDKTRPVDAWEYVADFSNMKYLNPSIVDFNILNESGNYDHWKYSTVYTEHLTHWPYLENQIIGHFDIKADENKNVFYINSTHRTCFYDYFCVDTSSSFKFSKGLGNTICQESIEYECPAIFSSFCLKEVQFQRNAIMRNLKLHFHK